MKIPYNELYEAYLIASQERYKYKEVIDKIKEAIKEVQDDEFYIDLINKEKVLQKILKLLEEIDV